MEKKILVNDNDFIECVDKLAIQITEMAFGLDTWKEDGDRVMRLTEDAEDFYIERANEYEALLNNTLNVWNKQAEI